MTLRINLTPPSRPPPYINGFKMQNRGGCELYPLLLKNTTSQRRRTLEYVLYPIFSALENLSKRACERILENIQIRHYVMSNFVQPRLVIKIEI